MAKRIEECPDGCDHDKRMAAGWGPGGRNELNVEQSHCPPKCSEFVDEREVRRMRFVKVNHGS